MTPPGKDKSRETRSYIVGYGGALALTGIAFALVRWPRLSPATTLATILALALVQAVVHFRFFLHLSVKRSARDDLQLVLFSTLIVALMVAGTLVILGNLRHRMM